MKVADAQLAQRFQLTDFRWDDSCTSHEYTEKMHGQQTQRYCSTQA